jgi:hypothetical protein
MRLFIAREALDPHLKVSGAVLNSKLPTSQRLKAAMKAGLFYARWYPKQWLPAAVKSAKCRVENSGTQKAGLLFKNQLRYAAKASRRLARSLFHAMVRKGPKLEREQLLLGRFVEIGTEIFAITATCLRARALLEREPGNPDYAGLRGLVEYFCSASKLRIEEKFRAVKRNSDRAGYRVAQQLLSMAKNGSH